ncbi:NAD-dependent epimerase/dehydratase family protein [Kitasatospora purpeofusca]|uniref:NAD-dependent epimerase/dehydratase family protein n=1 Tax=Kitasatospora purpeofusca TaxID=67352 RepID=UPI00225311D8|nr:NAD-dependent epimerase/dehydratase family protein [Kitasatospora purpeofusca]MCX4689309.1 NAD-dependent epimerase/dehydratase family protein [Kitasatospora purpeofusca]MCX4756456.1 NAD-dependent epimerase/dehydratase family protein [Kitasatospora purpeofusca]WSR35732.1 NAD-dependent epimerase/dehydratase family protein [Kitasatospora purpeofusca]WSR44039.1 NAD-dependent epimerase/dehydratase family protein [Kitasatospora purpeofusca]
MRVVVTGGAGFIGANLVRALLARPEVDQVRVVDNLSTGQKANLEGTGAVLHEGTILDPELLDEAFAGADAVVHLAALPSVPRSVADPLASHHANATGTLEVLEAARRAGGLYVAAASSSSVYGANRELPKRETMRTAPMSPYAVSKLATEAYLAAYHHCYGLGVLPLRFFNVFGPLQPAGHAYAAVVPAFLDAALAGRPLTVHGDGGQSRDFTFVGTVTQVITDAVLRRVVSPDPVNLAFGTRTSLLELVGELESVLGHPVEVAHTEPRPGDVRDSQADNARLRELFPDVRPVPLREGLERTTAWFRTL